MLITYRFVFPKGGEELFELRFDPDTMAYKPDASAEVPDWAKLENKQCRNCPLKADTSPHCPVARNLAPAITRFIDRFSYEEVDVVVTTPAREYRKHVSLQSGISALFGVIMTTSGCPALDKLRPMAFMHLPLAQVDETRYRAIAMYLFAQYFRNRKGLSADWTLDGLGAIYSAIEIVNRDFVARLRTIDMQDANLNAVVNLDCFSLGNNVILERSLGRLEKIFQPYL